MLGFLLDIIYVIFRDQVFQQSVIIPMGTNCAPLLTDLIKYSYEAEFVQKLLRNKNEKLAVSTDISMMSYQSTTIIFTSMFT
jgi:hypothetical protein